MINSAMVERSTNSLAMFRLLALRSHVFGFLAMAACLALLLGCATPPLTADQCTAADWQKVGVQDGRQGFPAGKLRNYSEDCAQFNIQPDQALYEQGRALGLAEYCTPQQGFIAGYKGHAYYDVCPEEAEKAFYPQYVLGSDLGRVEQRIFELENDLRVIEGDLRSYRRSSKWEDRRYFQWQVEHLYSRLYWLCAEESRLRYAAVDAFGTGLLRPRVGRFGGF